MDHAISEVGSSAQAQTVTAGEDVIDGGEVGVFGFNEGGMVEVWDEGVKIGAGKLEIDQVGEDEEVDDEEVELCGEGEEAGEYGFIFSVHCCSKPLRGVWM